MRTGIGYDIHRLIPTLEKSTIKLGGHPVACGYKIRAHSDGDVLLHALVDAMLGALSLGDIGQWFPDSAPENRDRPSCEFVKEVVAEISRRGWKVEHFDSIVLLEEPKLGPYRDDIRRSIASLLGVDLSQVSLKAKTMEGLGPIGEGRAVASYATVTLAPLLPRNQ